jgi:sugar lactone lactonase YvrE
VSRKSLRFGVLAGLLAFILCSLYFALRAPQPDGWMAKVARKAVRPMTVLGWSAHASTRGGDGAVGLIDGLPSRFDEPYGLVADGDVLYVSDAGDNNRIRVIGADGIASTLAGGAEGYADGAGALARFHTPSGMARDKDGNLYVADTGNHAIRKVTPAGVVTTVAGTGKPGYADGPGAQAQFDGPVGVAADGRGNLYVADTYNDRIRRIAPDGTVTTLAGGTRGDQDGAGMAARFDTPCGIAVDAVGTVLVADTRNATVRRIAPDGTVTTLAREGLLRRPAALALAHDGVIYVADQGGRIVQIALDGVQHVLADAAADPVPPALPAAPAAAAPTGTATVATPPPTPVAPRATSQPDLRLFRPAGIAFGKDDTLYVAEAARHVVRRLAPQPPAKAEPALQLPAAPAQVAWPVNPGPGFHEIVGTMGEVRGNYSGVARDHFHGGLDIQADMGTIVRAVVAGKVADPLAAWGAGDLGEGMAVGPFHYIHMRVGRDVKDASFDPARFAILRDEKGQPERVRVRRGTRFAAGDALGSVNRMYHVHLEYLPAGLKVNPLVLPFQGYRDTVAPTVASVTLVDAAQHALAKRGKNIVVPRTAGLLGIVIDAYDQMDGNAARRRLGLYKLGYQLLRADGTPVPGYEQLRVTLEFDMLPAGQEAVTVAYAEQSGITVHGNAQTRFLYAATNTVKAGQAKAGTLDVSALAPGDYLLRIVARDQAGNDANGVHELPLKVE